MKILFLQGNFFKHCSGGAEYQAYLLAKHLVAEHSVSYIYVDNNNGWSASECEGIRLYPIRKRSFARRLLGKPYALDYFRLNNLFERIKPDVIYSRGGFAYLGIAARYCRRNCCRLVWHIAHERDVTPNDYGPFRTAAFRWLDKRLLEYGIRHAASIIAQAKYQDLLLQRNYGRSCNEVIPNAHPLPQEGEAAP